MSAVLICLVVTTFHLLVGILIPGLALELRLAQNQKLPNLVSALLSRIIALGLLYLLVQFLLLHLADIFFSLPRYELVIAKYVIDLSVLASLLFFSRAAAWNLVTRIFSGLQNPAILTLVVGSFALGMFAMLACPYSLDSSPICWLSKYLNTPGLNLIASKGSPTYIAMLYFPGQILHQWFPVPTIAASLKPALCLLTALAVVHVVNRLQLKNRNWMYWLLFIMVAASFFGIYGLQQTGKHSVFGAVFLAIFAADLFLPTKDDRLCIPQAGLSLSAAMGLGVITIPYALVISSLFLVLASNRINSMKVAYSFALWAGLPFILSLSSMVGIPLWQSALLPTILVASCFLLNKFASLNWLASVVVKPWFRYAPICVIVCSWIGLSFTLPVEYGNGLRPLDGKTSFYDLLFKFERQIPEHVVVFGLAGLLISCLVARRARNPGLMAYAVFPFFTLLGATTVAHFPASWIPLKPQHFWDLIKDIPNWCYGFYFGSFAAVATDIFVENAKSRWASRRQKDNQAVGRWSPAHAILLGSLIIGSSTMFHNWTRGPHWWGKSVYYTSVGGHQDLFFATLTETLLDDSDLASTSVADAKNEKPVYLTVNSDCNDFFNRLKMYGIAVKGDIDLSKTKHRRRILRNLPARVIAKRDEINSDFYFHKRPAKIEEMERLNETDSIFLVTPSDVSTGLIRFADRPDILLPEPISR